MSKRKQISCEMFMAALQELRYPNFGIGYKFVKNSFYIENLIINLKVFGYKIQKLAYLFPSKAPREFSPLICFLLDLPLRVHKNFFDFHVKSKYNKFKWEVCCVFLDSPCIFLSIDICIHFQ